MLELVYPVLEGRVSVLAVLWPKQAAKADYSQRELRAKGEGMVVFRPEHQWVEV